jgi:D-alanine-D-alanine ligase
VDLRIDDKGKVYALEVNTIPGLTGTSLLPKIAEKSGMDFTALLDEMLRDAIAREIL